MIEPLRAAIMAEGVAHGFFTRQGGVSTGLYASLNAGAGSADDADAVKENRRRVRVALAADALVTNYQVHSARVVRVKSAADDRRHRADALVTDRPGLALAVLTADCVPVLLADAQAGVVGAAHAGWKGALAGVLEATMDAMAGLRAVASRVQAAIGPAIRQPSYEVGAEVRHAFEALDPAFGAYFGPAARLGHFQFDLPGLVAARLERAGVVQIDDLGLDTYADAARFFSYRRTTHRGDADYGRHVSAIVLRP